MKKRVILSKYKVSKVIAYEIVDILPFYFLQYIDIHHIAGWFYMKVKPIANTLKKTWLYIILNEQIISAYLIQTL